MATTFDVKVEDCYTQEMLVKIREESYGKPIARVRFLNDNCTMCRGCGEHIARHRQGSTKSTDTHPASLAFNQLYLSQTRNPRPALIDTRGVYEQLLQQAGLPEAPFSKLLTQLKTFPEVEVKWVRLVLSRLMEAAETRRQSSGSGLCSPRRMPIVDLPPMEAAATAAVANVSLLKPSAEIGKVIALLESWFETPSAPDEAIRKYPLQGRDAFYEALTSTVRGALADTDKLHPGGSIPNKQSTFTVIYSTASGTGKTTAQVHAASQLRVRGIPAIGVYIGFNTYANLTDGEEALFTNARGVTVVVKRRIA
ncbi:MAG TPA: hypothetical protein VEF04_12400, partial [Blastocatellia bacterium]|nr:hypothetical protein [Blastocatellia bacterium]